MNQQVRTAEPSKILRFYENKSVFITGATGFLGKVLLEKLLRSCYNLRQIYILIRPKRGLTASDRLNKLVDCKV